MGGFNGQSTNKGNQMNFDKRISRLEEKMLASVRPRRIVELIYRGRGVEGFSDLAGMDRSHPLIRRIVAARERSIRARQIGLDASFPFNSDQERDNGKAQPETG